MKQNNMSTTTIVGLIKVILINVNELGYLNIILERLNTRNPNIYKEWFMETLDTFDVKKRTMSVITSLLLALLVNIVEDTSSAKYMQRSLKVLLNEIHWEARVLDVETEVRQKIILEHENERFKTMLGSLINEP
jgi:hypothetical protein